MHTAFFGLPKNSQVIRVRGAAAPRVFLTRITCLAVFKCTAVVLLALSAVTQVSTGSWIMASRKGWRKAPKLSLGCWNMRTLVESDGSIETAVARKSSRGVAVDKKASLMVMELKKYRMNVVGISETKWFGSAVYSVDGHVILHSGRPVPADGNRALRNEGVAIVLDPTMAENWKSSGGEWQAVSSRIVSARLKLGEKVGQRGRREPVHGTIVSVYAPTHRANQEEKDKFYTDLQSQIDGVAEEDILVVVGDFNARVGSSERHEDIWNDVRGYHGVGRINEAGETLLSWCASNSLTVMNTMFEKKNIHKYTWQHPGSKQWHCIDYIIMRQKQRIWCCDVSVLRSADCWTDHKLLRAQMKLQCITGRKSTITRKKFGISVLQSREISGKFSQEVCKLVKDKWVDDLNGSDMWNVIRDGMKEAAQEVLGWERRKQPDWFHQNSKTLEELIVKRNRRFKIWLNSGKSTDRKEYVALRKEVATAIKKAKNDWLQKKAKEIESKMQSGTSGRGVSNSLKDIQKGQAGRRPIILMAVRKTNGEICKEPEETLNRWQEHFNTLLNISSDVPQEVLDDIPQLPLRKELDLPPSKEEVLDALSSIKGNKSGGKNGILPEMLKCCGEDLMEYLLKLFNRVWQEQNVPQEWKDALITPIPKKGDLSSCDNWRGISLLDVAGKVFAKTLQKRLQNVAENVLPDTQCGFRSRRGCIDMIYCIRQLIEKAREHNTQNFILFIDLRKAYDSIPRVHLLSVLERYGIPPTLVSTVRSLHDDMKAEVTVNGQLSPDFEVKNGLRQGCVVAPSLFNLYFNLVINQWQKKCADFGVDILYKCSGKLVGERTRKPDRLKISELLFADDAAAVSTSRRSMEAAAKALEGLISAWGLTLNIQKTKLLVAGTPRSENLQPLQLAGGSVECVTHFQYLGSVVEAKGGIGKEVCERIAKASRAFGMLKKPVFKDRNLSITTKRLVYKSIVLGVLLYGSETWTTTCSITRKLESFHNRCLKGILGITSEQQRMEKITSIQIAKRFGMDESLEDTIIVRHLHWLGHLARMEDDRVPKKMLFGWLPRPRPPHGTKMRWWDRVRKDLRKFGIDERTWYTEAQERVKWKKKWHRGPGESTTRRLQEDEQRNATRRTTRSGEQPANVDTPL